MRSSKVLQKQPSIVEKQEENKENENETPTQRKQNDDIKNKQMQPLHPPPFPKRLVQTKLPISLPQFDVLDELKNVYIKMEGDFINNMICIYNFLANLSPGMANILLNYKILCLLNTQMKSLHFFKVSFEIKITEIIYR